MTKITTAILTGFLAIAGTSASANDGPKAPVVVSTTVTAPAAATVKAPVLLEARAPSRRVVRVIHEPAAIPVVRKAAMTRNTRFVFTSPKNTSTKTFRPAAPKHTSMPNHFKK